MTGPSSSPSVCDGCHPRILFVAEAVTLAHVARPVALARGLELAGYEITLAVAPRYREFWHDLPAAIRPIRSIEPGRFLEALTRGGRPYDVATLRAYVREDLEVLRETAPDAVIGDFRLSLAVSARVARVPYLAITNAYWSPYSRLRLPMPELPLTRLMGVAARPVFRAALPLVFAHHAAALNRVREDHGLPGLGRDLRRVYTEADHTLYADVPGLVPTDHRPASHHYLGPILWSPPVGLPRWWEDLPDDRPAVYVTMGSSGRANLLAAVLEALAGLPVSVMAADPSGSFQGPVPPNARVARLLPGSAAAARARLVICNGGSPTAHQALAVGTPVLGIAGNMDQHLNMEAIRTRGAGVLLRSDGAKPAAIRSAVTRMLAQPDYAASAARVASEFSPYDASRRLREILSAELGFIG